jgi:hypothetical protein
VVNGYGEDDFALMPNNGTVYSSITVYYKVMVNMEEHFIYNAADVHFLVSTQLRNATDSGLLTYMINSRIFDQLGPNSAFLNVTNFRAEPNSMEISFIRSYSPTAMPTLAPTPTPDDQHTVISATVLIVSGACLIIGIMTIADHKRHLEKKLENSIGSNIHGGKKSSRIMKSSATAPAIQTTVSRNYDDQVAILSNPEYAKGIVRTSIPFLHFNEEELIDSLIKDPAASLGLPKRLILPFEWLYVTAMKLFHSEVWRHQRYLGSLFYSHFQYRASRLFYVLSMLVYMILFDVIWLEDNEIAPMAHPGFRHINMGFFRRVFAGVLATAVASVICGSFIFEFYRLILDSLTLHGLMSSQSATRHKTNSVAPASSTHILSTNSMSPSSPRSNSTRSSKELLSPSKALGTSMASIVPASEAIVASSSALAPSPSKAPIRRTRRDSVRATAFDIVKRASVAGGASGNTTSETANLPLQISNRRVNFGGSIRDVGSPGAVIADEAAHFDGKDIFSLPKEYYGVHNMKRLQNEIKLCRSAVLFPNRRFGEPDSKITVDNLARCSRFDMIWGLDDSGALSMATPQLNINSWSGQLALSRDLRNSFQLSLLDLFHVHHTVGSELYKMQAPSVKEHGCYTEADQLENNRRRIVQLFAIDVLPRVDRSIVQNQMTRDEKIRYPMLVPFWLKRVGSLFTFAVFAVALFLICWIVYERRNADQTNILIVFITWVVLDVFFVSTLSVIMKHILLPNLAKDETARVLGWLCNRIDRLFASTKTMISRMKLYKGTAAPTNLYEAMLKSNARIWGDVEGSDLPSWVHLNSAHHFFVSSRIACVYPLQSPEIRAIYSFQSMWPKRNMSHVYWAARPNIYEKEVVSVVDENTGFDKQVHVVHVPSENKNLNAALGEIVKNKSAPSPAQWMWEPRTVWQKTLCAFLAAPMIMQDIIVDAISWIIVLGMLYLHFYLFYENPLYLLIPIPGSVILLCLLCLLGVFGNYEGHRASKGLMESEDGVWRVNQISDDRQDDSMYIQRALDKRDLKLGSPSGAAGTGLFSRSSALNESKDETRLEVEAATPQRQPSSKLARMDSGSYGASYAPSNSSVPMTSGAFNAVIPVSTPSQSQRLLPPPTGSALSGLNSPNTREVSVPFHISEDGGLSVPSTANSSRNLMQQQQFPSFSTSAEGSMPGSRPATSTPVPDRAQVQREIEALIAARAKAKA